jgi:mRNA interferase YafQ
MNKRASPPRNFRYAKAFLKDWERLSRTGRFNMGQLKQALLHLISNDAPLGPEWLDHPLKGEWSDHRECHIGGDFLLIYQVEGDIINFVRCGTHSELFD